MVGAMVEIMLRVDRIVDGIRVTYYRVIDETMIEQFKDAEALLPGRIIRIREVSR